MHFSSIFRLALVAAVFAGVPASARPAFVEQGLEPSGRATVKTVVEGTFEDFVVLEGGLRAGFRPGMVAVVERGDRSIARLLIAEANDARAVALILELAPQQTIQSEDRVLRSLLSIS